MTCTNYTAGSDEKNVTRHAMQEGRVTERIEGGNYRDRFAYNPDGTLAAYTFGPGSEQVMNYQWMDGRQPDANNPESTNGHHRIRHGDRRHCQH